MSCRPGPSSAATVTGEPSKNCDERGPLEVLSEADAMFSNDNFAWQMLQNRPSRNILTLNPEIGSSSPLDPLLDLKTLFEILLKSKIPGPKLFRLKSEYSTLLGRGRTFEVFGVSTGYSNLLDYSEGVVSRSGIGQNHERIRESLRGSAIYAIKRARGPTDSDLPGASYGFGFQIRSARREIETLCREPFRNHPNIVRLLGWGLCLDTLEEKVDENPRIPLLILERADCSLTDFLKRGFPSYQDSLNICLDAGNGLSIIHKEGIVHGDMKPDNILMFRFNGRWITKLCDFGLATSEEERDQDTFEYRGTPGWRPPESSQRLASRSLQLCDVFAYGLVVQSVFKCDWRAPLLDPEVDTPPVHNVKEEHIYRRFASEIRKMPHIPNLEINRVLLVLRGCLHTEPSLRKRKPWKYLNQDKYPVIDEAAEIDLAEPIVRVSSPASERSGEWLERPFYVSWLLAACCYFGTLIVQWYRSVVQSLQLFLAELIQLLIQGSLEVKSWLLKTREKSIQQRKYEEIFHSLSSELGLCGNLNDITTFEHPPDQCFKLPSHLYISASHTTYDSNNADDMHLGELSVSVYGWARMRSRFRLCCWQRSMAAFYPSFRTSDIVDFSTLAWILRGDIGSYELARLSPCARWGFLRSCSPRDCTDRMILLMESGCNIGERIGCGCHVGERLKLYTAFRMYLQRCRDGDFDPPLAVMLCRYFKHIAEDQKQTDQVRFFLTGKGLPDRLNEGNDDEDDDGFSTTALHESVLESQYPVVEYLVRSGFVVNATNKDGKTAFQLAYERSQMVREIEKSDILQNERILALLGQHQANSLDIDDLNSGLPLGWEQLQLGPPHSETLFHEKHFGSITFKTPTFSLLDSRRLALGFRRVENSGQTYLLDIVRFIDRGIAGNELLPSIMVSKFSNQWYRDDISRIEYCQTRATGTQESGRNGVSAVKWIHRMQVAMTVTVPRALISLGEELTGFGQRGHMSHLNWVSPNNTDFMFIFVLLCVVSHYSSWPYPTTFVLSVLALIPLVTALHSCIRSISSRLGCSDADSLAAILEYVLELVISITAYIKGEIHFIQTLIVGTVMTNSLLILGSCFFLHALPRTTSMLRRPSTPSTPSTLSTPSMPNMPSTPSRPRMHASGEKREPLMKRCTPMKHYTPMVTITTLAILGPVFLILPCAFYNVLEPDIDGGVVVMSRGIAVVSLSVYLLMLLFQFKTHEAPQQSYQELTELPITLAVIAVCGNILIMIPCVYFLVNAVTQFEPSEKLICGLFVIPIATRMQIYIVALGDGLRHGVELASARVYCRSLPAVLFIYPTMVILSWIVEGEQQSLTMRFDAIDVKVLGIVVWTNNMSLRYRQMDYLLGTELLIVYCILSMVLYIRG